MLMAQRVSYDYVDDLDGAPIEAGDVRAVKWSWDGIAYEFDTAARNLGEIEAGHVSVAALLAASRTAAEADSALGVPPRARTTVVRAWARDHHYNSVGTRGRLSKTVLDAFDQAH